MAHHHYILPPTRLRRLTDTTFADRDTKVLKTQIS
jgi:hypothetical protein